MAIFKKGNLIPLRRSESTYLALFLGIAVPLLLTLVDWPFRNVLTPSNILLVYLLGVFFVAMHFGLLPSILASLTSAGAFAFFFAPPIFSFAIVDQENLMGLVVMLVVGVVTSNLAENILHHTIERVKSIELAKEVTLKMQAETLRNSLLSSISHDLRNPLAIIVGAASTLESDEQCLDAVSRRKLVKVISEEAQRMSDLTIKILEMARLEAGEVILNRQWFAPEEIVGSALSRLDKQLKSRPVNIHMPENLALINVDAVLLQQVMVNLLDNADKYSDSGLPIDISVGAMSLGLYITIADRGPGIPAGLQQKIFEKFFRINEESAQSGVGLGLSICRAIIEAHGGEIQATNRSGGGALFQIYLPILESPPSVELEENELLL
ncbi:MAG: ATP-binding protein [Methylococcales bacterium]